MTLQTAMAAAAGLVALAFWLSILERWMARRRPHELAWTISLAMFTLASAAFWVGAAAGWDGLSFRLFYLFGAILNVPFLALGTVYLLGGRRRGDRWAVVIVLGSAFAAGVVLVAPFDAPIPVHRLPQGSEVFGPLPRVLAAVASGVGALVVVGGAVWSARRARRRAPDRNPADARRLAWANVMIAAGTIVLGVGGVLNSALGEMEAFAVSLVIGIAAIFCGFLVASAPVGAPADRVPAVTPVVTGLPPD
jgi:hypothetical protein